MAILYARLPERLMKSSELSGQNHLKDLTSAQFLLLQEGEIWTLNYMLSRLYAAIVIRGGSQSFVIFSFRNSTVFSIGALNTDVLF